MSFPAGCSSFDQASPYLHVPLSRCGRSFRITRRRNVVVRKHGRLVLIRLGIALLLFRPTIAAAQAERDQTNNAPHVRVLSNQGVVREGRLVLLTSSDAVLLTNGFVESLPLEDVRHINRVTHGARNGFLAAALSGLVVVTASCSSSTRILANARRRPASCSLALALPLGRPSGRFTTRRDAAPASCSRVGPGANRRSPAVVRGGERRRPAPARQARHRPRVPGWRAVSPVAHHEPRGRSDALELASDP